MINWPQRLVAYGAGPIVGRPSGPVADLEPEDKTLGTVPLSAGVLSSGS
jgi:hypothetical protein